MANTQLTLHGVLKDVGFLKKPPKLPARIDRAIRQQDDASEVLVKLLQLTVVGIMGVLYLLSPKTDAGTAFSPVPYALLGYLVLNSAALVWALRRGLPNWAVYISIVFDITLLMVLIWTFHIQYDQPPAFYLKAPTLLYIFIFIALRALRFQARFVLAAGLIAALGWGVMIAYVTLSDPANSMITRNYVEYLTSNAILLGAEFDKIISILIVTGILALALKRAHDLLVRAVSEKAAAENLSSFFDDNVASLIARADEQIAPGTGVSRNAAILNVDIRGFTEMAADMDPSTVMSVLTDYQRRLVPAIQAHGGTIDKFLGDGIMASFGAVTPTSTYAADALKAVDAVLEAIGDWQGDGQATAPYEINLAVAAGPVSFGAVGDEKRLEYTVIGAAVNLSAKLEKYNKDAGSRALVDRETYDTACRQGYRAGGRPRTLRAKVPGTARARQLVVLA